MTVLVALDKLPSENLALLNTSKAAKPSPCHCCCMQAGWLAWWVPAGAAVINALKEQNAQDARKQGDEHIDLVHLHAPGILVQSSYFTSLWLPWPWAWAWAWTWAWAPWSQ
jgi:hypothetical protein